MKTDGSSSLTRRSLLGAFAATAVAAAPTYSNAAGFLRGGGDIRIRRMYSGRTGERLDTVYWIDGRYIGEAIREVNLFMRDWRNGKAIEIDTRTVDIMTAAHNLMETSQPYMLLSGYRSPATNAMLRSRSRGVAKNSLHLKGQAADLRLGNQRDVSFHPRDESAVSRVGVAELREGADAIGVTIEDVDVGHGSRILPGRRARSHARRRTNGTVKTA